MKLHSTSSQTSEEYGAFIQAGNGGAFFTPVLGGNLGQDFGLPSLDYLYRNYTLPGMLQTKIEEKIDVTEKKISEAKQDFKMALIGASILGAVLAGGVFYLSYLSITNKKDQK